MARPRSGLPTLFAQQLHRNPSAPVSRDGAHILSVGRHSARASPLAHHRMALCLARDADMLMALPAMMLAHRQVQRLFSATAPWLGFGPLHCRRLFHAMALDFRVWKHWCAQLRAQRVTVIKLSRACYTRAVRTGRSCAPSVAPHHRLPHC